MRNSDIMHFEQIEKGNKSSEKWIRNWKLIFIQFDIDMIDWVSIVRHSRRRFSNYVGSRSPVRMRRRRRQLTAPPPQQQQQQQQYHQQQQQQPQQHKSRAQEKREKDDADGGSGSYVCCCSNVN